MTEKRKSEPQMKYIAKTRRRYVLNLNKVTDTDMIEHLESLDNVQGYIKRLIQEDMNRKV